MIIQYNLQARNADRMLGNVSLRQDDTVKKLSSGYRMNRAADDAAGLTISGNIRAFLGAVQNRLEHTIVNLDNTAENTAAAQSRIRDTDMAQNMVAYGINHVLAQAGQTVLAQANQNKKGV